MEIKRNRTRICGMKDRTPERPAQIPSLMRPCAHAAAPTFSRPVAMSPPIWSVIKPIKLNTIAPGVDMPSAV